MTAPAVGAWGNSTPSYVGAGEECQACLAFSFHA